MRGIAVRASLNYRQNLGPVRHLQTMDKTIEPSGNASLSVVFSNFPIQFCIIFPDLYVPIFRISTIIWYYMDIHSIMF